MEDIKYIVKLIENKLGLVIKEKYTINRIREVGIRTFKDLNYSYEDKLKILRRVLEDGNFLFLINKNDKIVEYNGVNYGSYNKWVNSLEIVTTELLDDILKTDWPISKCIIKNESNPEFKFNVEFYYDNDLFTSVRNASEKYKVKDSILRQLMRKGLTPQEALDELRNKSGQKRDIQKEREIINYLSKSLEDRIGVTDSLIEILNALANVYDVELIKLNSLWDRCKRDPDTFLKYLDVSIKYWKEGKYSLSENELKLLEESKSRSRFSRTKIAEEKGITLVGLDNYLTKLSVSLDDFFYNPEKFSFVLNSKTYWFPEELSNDTGLGIRLIYAIVNKSLELDFKDRCIYIEFEVKYYKELLTYKGTEYNSFTKLNNSLDLNSTITKSSYSRRDSPEVFHSNIDKVLKKKVNKTDFGQSNLF